MPNQPLPYHPKRGEVLNCDYSGLIAPEMDKVRAAVVVSPKFLNRPNLCTVVPLSTTPPHDPQAYHIQLDRDPHPHGKHGAVVWAKCDMLMTVSFSRLTAFWVGKAGGRRNYVTVSVSNLELGRISQGVLAALGMLHLWK